MVTVIKCSVPLPQRCSAWPVSVISVFLFHLLPLCHFPQLAPHSLLYILVSLPNTPRALTKNHHYHHGSLSVPISHSLLLSLSLSVVWDNSKLYYRAALNGNWPCSWAQFSPVSRWHTACGPEGMKQCLPFDSQRPLGTVAPSCPVYSHCWKHQK